MSDIDTRYATVGELLKRTVEDPDLHAGEGAFAHVYRFPPDDGLDSFLLRARKGQSLRTLSSSTSLSPLPNLLIHTNLGQPLLCHGNPDRYKVGVILRHPGQSLNTATRGKNSEERCEKLYDTLKTIERNTGENPFVSLLEQAISIDKAGHLPDFDWGNIMVKEGLSGLGLIDQLHYESSGAWIARGQLSMLESTKDRLVKSFEYHMSWGGVITMHPGADRILGMIHQAARQVLHKHIEKGEDAIAPAVFVKTDSTQAVALSDPPHMLVERLRELQGIVNAPTR